MTDKSIDSRLEERAMTPITPEAGAPVDVNDRVSHLEERIHDLAQKLSRQTDYFGLLIAVLHHHSVIDENQFAAATKALDRELMNQQLRTNITEEEDGK